MQQPSAQSARVSHHWQRDSAGRWFYYHAGRDSLVYQNGETYPRPSDVPRSFYLTRQTTARAGNRTYRGASDTSDDDGTDDSTDDEAETTSGYTSARQQPARALQTRDDHAHHRRPSVNVPELGSQMQRLQMGNSSNSTNYALTSSSRGGPSGTFVQEGQDLYSSLEPVRAAQRRRVSVHVPSSGPRTLTRDDYTSFDARINGRVFRGKFDPGADSNFVSMDVIQAAGLVEQLQPLPRTTSVTFHSFAHGDVVPRYVIDLTWSLERENIYRERCYVLQDAWEDWDLVIGTDFIRREQIVAPGVRTGALPLRRDPQRIAQDRSRSRQERADEANALRETQLQESSNARAQQAGAVAASGPSGASGSSSLPGSSGVSPSNGRMLNVQGRQEWINAVDLQQAATLGNAYRVLLGCRITPADAMSMLVIQHMGSGQWTRDRSEQYLRRMLIIDQAARS